MTIYLNRDCDKRFAFEVRPAQSIYSASVQRVHHSSWRRKSRKSRRKNSVALACFDGLGAAPRHTKKGRGDAASNTNSRGRFARTNRDKRRDDDGRANATRRELRTRRRMNVGERGEKKDREAVTVRICMKIRELAMISPSISERATEIPASVCRGSRATPTRQKGCNALRSLRTHMYAIYIINAGVRFLTSTLPRVTTADLLCAHSQVGACA